MAEAAPVVPGLVSTIIPVHNRPGMLRDAVNSVLEQSYRPIEIIIVDDGSTDTTPQVIAQLRTQHGDVVRAVPRANAGPGAARESGRLLARGEFIQYLDSDDILLPDKFAMQVAALRADHEADACYGLVWDEDAKTGTRSAHAGTAVARRELLPWIVEARLWPTLSPLYRRRLTDRIGPWSTGRIFEDWDYECRAGLLGAKLSYCDRPVAVTRDGGDEHAGLAWMHDARSMQDRIEAYFAIAGYAQRAGLGRRSPQLRKLVRSIFWMAREAGARGFTAHARRLLHLASRMDPLRAWEYRGVDLLASLLGWRHTLRLLRRSP